MIPIRACLGLAAVGMGGAACAERAAAPAATYTVDTLPGGVTHVRNTGEGQWSAETTRTLEEDLRLGTADVEGPELFGRSRSRRSTHLYAVVEDELADPYVVRYRIRKP